MGQKRQLTEDQLKKLAVARQKALETKAKQSAVKKAEKEKQKKELDDKYNNLVATPAQQSQETIVETTVDEQSTPSLKPKRTSKKVIEIDSDDTSDSSDSSDSDTEYDITPVRQKYKQKYKNKYLTKYKSHDPLADITTIARHNIHNKVSDELKKMAFSSLFG